MEYRIFLLLAPFFIFAVLFLLILSWKRREYSSAKYLFVFVCIVLGYLVSNVSELLYAGETWILSWTKAEHFFASLIPAAWLLFIFEFTGRHERQRPGKFWPFCIPAVLNIALAFSNDLHHAFWKGIRFVVVENFYVLRTSYGGAFYFVYTLHYGLLAFGTYLAVKEYIRSHAVYRKQLFWILLGMAFAVFLNLVYVLRLFPWLRKDFTPFGYALGSMAFAVGIFRHRFLDVIPFSRTRLFDYLGEGILVTDGKNRIIDMNKTALRILGLSAYRPGETVYRYSLVVPVFEAGFDFPGDCFRKDVRSGTGSDRRHYEITLNKMTGARKNYLGSVVVVHDITERVRMFEELKTLRGIVPICAKCKRVRTDEGYWQQVEAYVSEHSYAEFSHGLCPSCVADLYPDVTGGKDSE